MQSQNDSAVLNSVFQHFHQLQTTDSVTCCVYITTDISYERNPSFMTQSRTDNSRPEPLGQERQKHVISIMYKNCRLRTSAQTLMCTDVFHNLRIINSICTTISFNVLLSIHRIPSIRGRFLNSFHTQLHGD